MKMNCQILIVIYQQESEWMQYILMHFGMGILFYYIKYDV